MINVVTELPLLHTLEVGENGNKGNCSKDEVNTSKCSANAESPSSCKNTRLSRFNIANSLHINNLQLKCMKILKEDKQGSACQTPSRFELTKAGSSSSLKFDANINKEGCLIPINSN